ncbi:hypothetical protein V3589_11380 [Sinorhizobium fredii]|uniref:hypothetical protein n=1 Tax=Rhizobium fredii TaxID=380 RepID=UPI0030A2DD83
MTNFSEQELEVRLQVQLSFVVTAGAYAGPVSRETVAALVGDLVSAAGGVVPEMIDRIEIVAVQLEDGTAIVEEAT